MAGLVVNAVLVVAFAVVALVALGFSGEDGLGAVALVPAAAFGVLAVAGAGIFAYQLRERGRARRRVASGARARATVVEAKALRLSSHESGLRAWDLTVEFEPAGRAKRRITTGLAARFEPGDELEVLYDAEDPTNFGPTGG